MNQILKWRNIIFYDWKEIDLCDDEPENKKPDAYTCICFDCAVKYGLKKKDLVFEGVSRYVKCDVEGCRENADMFIDMSADTYEILNKVIRKDGVTFYRKQKNRPRITFCSDRNKEK